MIKQIQLRGISRTPSDRLSEDGGLSESLNMYLDTAENAPAFVPEDVTTKLGLPANLVAERIFIHKTANYENYIVVQEGKIVAYTPGIEDEEPLLVMELAEGEKVKSINQVGNTLMISLLDRMFYSLWKANSYFPLGDNIPFPTIEFWDDRTPIADPINSIIFGSTIYHKAQYINTPIQDETAEPAEAVTVLNYYSPQETGPNTKDNLLIDFTAWDEDFTEDTRKEIVSVIKQKIDSMVSHNAENGYFCFPIWAMYAVRLYDGSLMVSIPQLVSAGIESPVSIKGWGDQDVRSQLYLRLNHYYKLGIRRYDFPSDTMENWQDIVKGIDIYISEDINRLSFDDITLVERHFVNANNTTSSLGHMTFAKFQLKGEETSFIQHALACSNFVKVEEFSLGQSTNPNAHSWDELSKDYICDSKSYIKNENRFSGNPLLSDQNYKFKSYDIVADSIVEFNKTLLFAGARKIYAPGMQYFCAQRYNTIIPWVIDVELYKSTFDIADLPSWVYLEDAILTSTKDKYSFAFLMEDGAIVYGKSKSKDTFEINNRYSDLSPAEFCLLLYPDSKCRGAIYIDDIRHSVEMTPHPYLPNCSYYYEKILLEDLDGSQASHLPIEHKQSDTADLYISEISNPFLIARSFSFQSKVLGVALATTALSQGQFGQFPLYVFTEDGIWAMETGADGSFVSQKPLSREVCINPDSICSIDNAVVFVTSKAVMMIQGSQVMNISPYMNGRHYTPNESALNIIGKQEGFEVFTDVISDEDPFMSFMKDAKVAYDYTGQRLIFISPSNRGFEYVYKIDTQTWHKVAFEGFNLDAPLNSYPECLVIGAAMKPSKGSVENAADVVGVDVPTLSDALEKGEKIVIEIEGDEHEFTEALKSLAYEATLSDTIATEEYRITISASKMVEDRENYVAGVASTLGISLGKATALLNGEATGEYTYRIAKSDSDTYNEQFEYLFSCQIELLKSFTTATLLIKYIGSKVYSLSTVLDAKPDPENPQKAAKGILITRPFDLGMPDVYKSITNIKIRGDFDKGNVKYILQGSNDGRTFYTLNTLRGKSWRMFRLFILADLEPTERISWIDIDFEPRYNNRLR